MNMDELLDQMILLLEEEDYVYLERYYLPYETFKEFSEEYLDNSEEIIVGDWIILGDDKFFNFKHNLLFEFFDYYNVTKTSINQIIESNDEKIKELTSINKALASI